MRTLATRLRALEAQSAPAAAPSLADLTDEDLATRMHAAALEVPGVAACLRAPGGPDRQQLQRLFLADVATWDQGVLARHGLVPQQIAAGMVDDALREVTP